MLATRTRVSRLAIASVVFALMGILPLPLIGSLVAFVVGISAKYQIDHGAGEVSGVNLARIGIFFGFMGIMIWPPLLVAAVIAYGGPPVLAFVNSLSDAIFHFKIFPILLPWS